MMGHAFAVSPFQQAPRPSPGRGGSQLLGKGKLVRKDTYLTLPLEICWVFRYDGEEV